MLNPLLVMTLIGAGLLLGLGTASAHVTVSPGTAVAGSYTVLTFKVPNESATAKTVGVTISFPTDHPFASVSVHKQVGWTSTATQVKLKTPIKNDDNLEITQAVSSITFKADPSADLSLGEFAEFDVQVGPVPDDVTSLSFPAVQNYSDGSVVNWNEPTPASGPEPEHPAPTVTIVAAAPTSAAGASSGASVSSAAAAPTVTVTAAPAQAAGANPSDGSARALAVVGIVLAALALLTGALALRRRAS